MLRRGLSLGVVTLVGVVVLVLAVVGLGSWSDGGHALPPTGYPAALPLVAVAAVVLALARTVRRAVRGDRPVAGPQEALRSFRVLVLCQAAALTGAVVVGWYAALAVVARATFTLEGWSSPTAKALATALAGALLVLAGLLGQSWCRLPEPPEDPERDQDAGRA